MHICDTLIGPNCDYLSRTTFRFCLIDFQLNKDFPSQFCVFNRKITPGGYSSMIWVGTCRWDLKSRPIFIPNFAEKWDPFYTEATNFKQNLPKISHYFPKLLSFQANLGNFGIRLMKLGLFSRQFWKILKIWPMFIPVFALNKESSLYQEADFETHFSGTSPDRPLY